MMEPKGVRGRLSACPRFWPPVAWQADGVAPFLDGFPRDPQPFRDLAVHKALGVEAAGACLVEGVPAVGVPGQAEFVGSQPPHVGHGDAQSPCDLGVRKAVGLELEQRLAIGSGRLF